MLSILDIKEFKIAAQESTESNYEYLAYGAVFESISPLDYAMTYSNMLYKDPVDHYDLFDRGKILGHKSIWSLFYYFSVIIDKLRFLTLGALIIFLQIILISRVKSSNASWRNFIHTNISFLYLFLISFVTLSLATIIYVAGNGRYIMPFVLLIYIFFFIERGERVKVSNQHRP